MAFLEAVKRHPAMQPGALIARASMVAIVILTFTWMFVSYPELGPTKTQKDRSSDGVSWDAEASSWGKSTKRLTSLHAMIFVLAYVLCMTEALLAYRAPIFDLRTSRITKWVHLMLHTAALALIAVGIATAVLLKDRAVPSHDHNWSTHAWMGLMCWLISIGQFFYGLYVYMLSSWTVEQRKEHTKMHAFMGMAAWLTGLAACASGWAEENMSLHLTTLEHKDNHKTLMLSATACGSLTVILGLAGAYVYAFHPLAIAPMTVEPFNEAEKDAGDK